MQSWQKTGPVSPCLGTSQTSRKIYNSRYLEFIQRYVNSYENLNKDMEDNATDKKEDGRSTDRTRKKNSLLKGLGFTKIPFVSTSENVLWGLKYATGIVNWDKDKHQPRPNTKTLSPSYQQDGHPRFPYLGILYVTLHTPTELTDDLTARITDLFTNNLIDTKCASPGGHAKGGYLKACERIFIAGIDAEKVKISTVVRAPNFYNSSYPTFMENKYGINAKKYFYFQNKLSYWGSGRNPKAFSGIERDIVEYVIERKKDKIMSQVKSLSEKLYKELLYLGKTSDELVEAPCEIKELVNLRRSNMR